MKNNNNFNYSDNQILEIQHFVGTICMCCGRNKNIPSDINKYTCVCGSTNNIEHIHVLFESPDYGPSKKSIESKKENEFNYDFFNNFPIY